MVLKPSEKRLLIVFGVAIFLIGNIAAWSILQEKEIKVSLDQTKLEKELKRLQALQSQVPVAREYQAAMQKYLTRYDSLDTRDTYLGTFIQNGVDSLGLKLAKNAPLATDSGDGGKEVQFIKSGYQAEVSGDWKKVLEFVHTLQEPTEFRYVKSLNLTVRKSEIQDGESELVCNFVLQKWWHPESDTLLAEKAEASGEPAPAKAAEAPKPAASTAATPAPAETERKPDPVVENKVAPVGAPVPVSTPAEGNKPDAPQ